jgi:hypothetical protein
MMRRIMPSSGMRDVFYVVRVFPEERIGKNPGVGQSGPSKNIRP